MIEDTLGNQLIDHLSRDSTAIDACEAIGKKDNTSGDLAEADREIKQIQKPSTLNFQL